MESTVMALRNMEPNSGEILPLIRVKSFREETAAASVPGCDYRRG